MGIGLNCLWLCFYDLFLVFKTNYIFLKIKKITFFIKEKNYIFYKRKKLHFFIKKKIDTKRYE